MIIWLTEKAGYSVANKATVLGALRQLGISSGDVIFRALAVKSPGIDDYKKKKMAPKGAIAAARHSLSQDIQMLKPAVVVIADEGSLRAITDQPYTLAQVRGSVYHFEGTPCLCFDDLRNLYRVNHGKFTFGWDFAKVARYAKREQRTYPVFDFRLCRTVNDVRNFVKLSEFATKISSDTETLNQFITVISYTFDYGDKLMTFCVPFFDPFKPNGAYWASPNDEFLVRRELAKLHANPVTKELQNGMYDTAYFIEAGWEWNNYTLDTYHMMHALWCEAPKALHNICSYFLDNYVYWKDENKGVKEEGFGKDHTAVDRYWRYNGLDTYWTWLAGRELLSRICKIDWAMRNYLTEFTLAVGPCLAASLRGIKVDLHRHSKIMADKAQESEAGIADLRRLTGERDFNPRSPHDVAWWIYDVLGAKSTRLQRKGSKYGARSTDEKVLKLLKEQNDPILSNFIDRLLRAKQPAAVLSKYGNTYKLMRGGRFMCWMGPGGTETGRFNHGSSQFWVGTNGANIPKPLREIFVADTDYVFCDIDYSASDDRFIAYECEDPVKIDTVEGPLDTHCFHASIFFSKPYELIEAGWKNEDDWVTAEPKGIRQITKKITHGRNYLEGPGTMYNLMGRDAVVATALALGYTGAAGFIDKELIGICKFLSEKYDNPRTGLYKRIRPWQQEICDLAIKRGNLATTAFGFTRKFFGDLVNNPGTQRELASFYGQGDTAGNVNRSVLDIFYKSKIDDGRNVLFVLQVHDSILLAVHKSALHRIGEIVKIMEQPVTIHGREMRVPASPKVGLTWSKNMLTWKPDLTYQEILAYEAAKFHKKYPPPKPGELPAQNFMDMEVDLGGELNIEIPEFETELSSDETGGLEHATL